MAKTKVQKEALLTQIEEKLQNAASAVFVGFTGIDVAQETAIRKGFRAEGLGYTVVKKSLLRRVLEKLGFDHSSVPLEGEVAIAYSAGSDDETLAARRVYATGKEVGAEKFSILGGLFQGGILNAAAMGEIATIPPMHTLQGMFANIINSPLQRFAVVLDQVAQERAE